jgi:hypothetical protein
MPLTQDQWWEVERNGPLVGTRLFETVAQLEAHQADRRYANVVYNRLATGRDLPNVYGLAMSRRNYGPFSNALETYQPPAVNVCAMAVETLTASVGKNRPWIMFTTSGADWKTQRRARLLSRYIDGLFYEAKVWDVLPAVFRDMLTFADGIGAFKVFMENGKITCERVIPEELMVDAADAVHGRPRSLYQRTFASKSALAAKYPKHKDAIMAASGSHPGLGWARGENVPEQFAPVLEGWHLAEGDNPGRHVLCVGDKVIVDEAWEGGFPFAFCKGYPLGHGIFRQGIVEQLVPYQAKLDRLERVIDECHRRMGTPKWFAQNGSKVDAAKLIAKVAAVVYYNGTIPPQRDVGPAVPPELYQERERWIRLAFDRVGLSQDAITGQKPDGLNSGEAQRVHHNIAAVRQSTLGAALEACIVELAERMLELAKKHKPKVRAPGRRGLKLIEWSDAKFDPDGFTMMAFPISQLPAEPAGRLARANELLQMGTIDKGQYARILGNPDVDAATDPIEAARDCIESMLDSIVEDGEYQAPEKYQPPELSIELGMSRFLRERSLGAPDDVLEDLSRWIEEVRELAAPPAHDVAPAPGITQVAPADALPAPVPVPELAPAPVPLAA